MTKADIASVMTITLGLDELPPDPVFEEGIRRAPRRAYSTRMPSVAVI